MITTTLPLPPQYNKDLDCKTFRPDMIRRVLFDVGMLNELGRLMVNGSKQKRPTWGFYYSNDGVKVVAENGSGDRLTINLLRGVDP